MKKEKRLWIRMSENDIKILEKESNELKLSKSALLRIYIRSEKLKKVVRNLNQNKVMHSRILLEISRVAGNINQIAYHLNAKQMENDEALELFLKEAEKTNNIFDFFKNESKIILKTIGKVY